MANQSCRITRESEHAPLAPQGPHNQAAWAPSDTFLESTCLHPLQGCLPASQCSGPDARSPQTTCWGVFPSLTSHMASFTGSHLSTCVQWNTQHQGPPTTPVCCSCWHICVQASTQVPHRANAPSLPSLLIHSHQSTSRDGSASSPWLAPGLGQGAEAALLTVRRSRWAEQVGRGIPHRMDAPGRAEH